MTTPVRSRNDAGFSLVETLVTVVIVGITFVVFVGGMGTSFVASDRHRKQAVTQAGIRNFAEAVKAAPFTTDCTTVAAKYLTAYSPPPPERRSSTGVASTSSTHTAPGLVPSSQRSMLLAFYAIGVGTSMTGPNEMTHGWALNSSSAISTANRVSIRFADQALMSDVATGPRTVTTPAESAADSVSQLVSLASAAGAAAAPVRRDASARATAGNGGGNLKLTSPALTAQGDAMFAQVAVRGTATSVSPPPGWTLVNAKTHGSVASLVYERTATTPGAVDFVWNFSTVTEAAGGIVSYAGASTSGYQPSLTVQFWDQNTAGFTSTCPAEPAENFMQLVSLRLVSADQGSDERIDVLKRCHNKPTPEDVCGDAP